MKRKSTIALCALVLLTLACSTQKVQADDCSFACKFIPPANEVMHRFGETTETALSPEKISILVWNLHKDKDEGMHQDLDSLSKDKDLVLAQEFLRNSKFEAHKQFQWVMAAQFHLKDNVPTGVAVGAHVPALKEGYTRTVDLEPFVKSPKVQTITSYPLEGREDSLLIVNLHGMRMRDTAALQRQLDQASDAIAAHKGPAIYAGDFNTKNKDRNKMVDSWMAKRGFKVAIKVKLDAIWTRGLKTVEAKELTEIVSSDHKPLTAVLSVE